MTERVGRYLQAEAGPSKSGKTQVFDVLRAPGPPRLGVVRWSGRWRRYVFCPEEETLYDAECLRELAAFCEAKTHEHKQGWGKP